MINRHTFKNKYRVKTSRLSSYDYSSNGWYFVTICVKDRKCLLGKVENNKVLLSEIGKIVEQCWNEIPNHYENIMLDEYVIMPNHLHRIMAINNKKIIVNGRDAINRISTGGITKHNNPMGKHSLGEIIRYFKGKSTFNIHKFSPILSPLFLATTFL